MRQIKDGSLRTTTLSTWCNDSTAINMQQCLCLCLCFVFVQALQRVEQSSRMRGAAYSVVVLRGAQQGRGEITPKAMGTAHAEAAYEGHVMKRNMLTGLVHAKHCCPTLISSSHPGTCSRWQHTAVTMQRAVGLPAMQQALSSTHTVRRAASSLVPSHPRRKCHMARQWPGDHNRESIGRFRKAMAV